MSRFSQTLSPHSLLQIIPSNLTLTVIRKNSVFDTYKINNALFCLYRYCKFCRTNIFEYLYNQAPSPTLGWPVLCRRAPPPDVDCLRGLHRPNRGRRRVHHDRGPQQRTDGRLPHRQRQWTERRQLQFW